MAQWTCTIDDLAQAVGGQIHSNRGPFSFVGTDSRADLTGRLFVPLKGENFDAHDFVAAAVEKGATAVLVAGWRPEWEALKAKASFVQVADTLKALQAFGLFWRRKHNFKVIAITGSNGKTTTKEFALKIFKRKFATHASKGSYNNHWGVPLSILEAGPDTSHLILEMGMNHAGEIFKLCMIAEPNIVTVTTVGRAHIGELGSQENVANAKEEIYIACPKALHVFNIDNEWTMRMHARSHGQKITFSAFNPTADVHIRAQRLTWEGLDLIGQVGGVKGSGVARVTGRQNTVNLMAAAALALAAGMKGEEIWKALSEIHETAWGRNQILSMTNGARILFDAYNSNPDSMQALLKNLYEMEISGRKFLVMGDMKELGSFTDSAHEEVGERTAAVGFEGVWYIGSNAKAFARGLEKGGRPHVFFQSPDFDKTIGDKFLALFQDGDLVAVKGSRGMALERVVKAWPLSQPLGDKP